MKIKKGKDTIIFNIVAYTLVGVFALACIIPFYLIVVGSLTDEKTIITEGYQFFLNASNFSLESYQMALKTPETIIHAYGVTIFVTVVGTVLSIFLTTMTGYVLARPDFPWFIALAYWNDWYNCMLFMSTGENWNLQYTLQNILNSTEALKRVAAQTGMQVGQLPSEGLKLAMTVIATGPIVLLYPFLQKYFVKGLTIGAVKG